jgi:hypothetical protein
MKEILVWLTGWQQTTGRKAKAAVLLVAKENTNWHQGLKGVPFWGKKIR